MKMAKASEADLTMAMELANFLDAIERGNMPDTLSDDDDCAEWIDTKGCPQYDRLIEGLQDLLDQGSISRVIWGMAVVCDQANECIDPDADTIEHHPKRQQLEKQVELANQQCDDLLVALEGIAKFANSSQGQMALCAIASVRKSQGKCYYAPDGTLMNPDGTRSIFDDVDQ